MSTNKELQNLLDAIEKLNPLLSTLLRQNRLGGVIPERVVEEFLRAYDDYKKG